MAAHPWSSVRLPAAGAGAGSVDEGGVVDIDIGVVVGVVVRWRTAAGKCRCIAAELLPAALVAGPGHQFGERGCGRHIHEDTPRWERLAVKARAHRRVHHAVRGQPQQRAEPL